MGNHDARNVGYRHFEDFFGARDSVTTVAVAEGRAKVVAIDSTKPDLDEGEVGREHYGWLDAELRGWTEGPRIVVVHHHILAVPGTGRDVNNLRDAGDVMAILRELEVDLVLSGHRHVPYVWSISGVRVVHSGTVSTLRVRGTMPPSYNVIELDADEVRIAMREPGKGARARSRWPTSPARPSRTSEFYPRSSASCATTASVRRRRPARRAHRCAGAGAAEARSPHRRAVPGRRSSPCSRAARWRAGASRSASWRAARRRRSTWTPTTAACAATASPSGRRLVRPPCTPSWTASSKPRLTGPSARWYGRPYVRSRQAPVPLDARRLLLGAALGGVPAGAAVSFERTDVALPGAPDSVALGDLDGVNGKDIVIALPAPGNVGVMLNHGDGTFAAMQQYTAGPACAGLAVDITLGDVTQPAPGNRLLPDGKLDAYVACTPYVVRLTGDGAGALGNPEAVQPGRPAVPRLRRRSTCSR